MYPRYSDLKLGNQLVLEVTYQKEETLHLKSWMIGQNRIPSIA